MNEKAGRVVALGLGQTIAWASSYYLPAIVALAIAADLHVTTGWIYAGLTFGLIITAFVGPQVGRWIDHGHGRFVLCGSNLLFAAGLCVLALSSGMPTFFLAWLVVGLAMGAGLYDPAFATLTAMYGHGARSAITGITLIAGFASTVGWPVSAALLHRFGWRGTCITWALLHVTLGMAANAWAARSRGYSVAANQPEVAVSKVADAQPPAPNRFNREDVILAIFFVASGIVSAGIATQLPRIFMVLGASSSAAIGFASLMGPAQFGARIFEFSFLRRQHPLISARIAAALHPIGVALLAILGPPVLGLLAVVHGAGNGLITIARGTLPLALFGPQGYGVRVGRITAPSRIVQAFAPVVFGLAIDQIGGQILWISSGLSLVAVACLFLLPSASNASADPDTKRNAA